MKVIPTIFEDHEIRRLYDEKTETWFFSVVDIVQVLTQQPDFQPARKDSSFMSSKHEKACSGILNRLLEKDWFFLATAAEKRQTGQTKKSGA